MIVVVTTHVIHPLAIRYVSQSTLILILTVPNVAAIFRDLIAAYVNEITIHKELVMCCVELEMTVADTLHVILSLVKKYAETDIKIP